MHWKIMFDCCYCINLTRYLPKFVKNIELYFVTVYFHSQNIAGRFHLDPYPKANPYTMYKHVRIQSFVRGGPTLMSF